MGIDLRAGGRTKKTERRLPVSKNIYLLDLHKLYSNLARKTQSTFNQRVAGRLCMARTKRMPISLSRLGRLMDGKMENVACVVGTITDDERLLTVPKMNVVALHFTETARARIVKAGGRCLTFDQLAIERPTGKNCILLQGRRHSREACRHFRGLRGEVHSGHAAPRLGRATGRKEKALVAYGTMIVALIEKHTPAKCVIFGDLVYGACCIDDITAQCYGIDLFVHFGHSQIVPTKLISIPTIHIPVSVKADKIVEWGSELISKNISAASISLLSTAQFCHLLPSLKEALTRDEKQYKKSQINIPQSKPLRPGEFLGCTVPTLTEETEAVIAVVDGRFHIEAIGLQYPNVIIYRLDPFTCELSLETVTTSVTIEKRNIIIKKARDSFISAYESRKKASVDSKEKESKKSTIPSKGVDIPSQTTSLESKSEDISIERKMDDKSLSLPASIIRSARPAIILGTLGRQGSLPLLRRLYSLFPSAYCVLMDEITESKLRMLDCSVVIMVACPRLSIDWGSSFTDPILLTPLEAFTLAGRGAGEGDIHLGCCALLDCISERSMDSSASPSSSSASMSSIFCEKGIILDNFSIEGGKWSVGYH
ncbi:Diphthamide synthesis DPH1/DPH2 like protein [Aduncisulcus paluster]|uniref:2-(3-amino-3-carboxypropyl)histidine synthase subunit 1 n=1 Tax=Aduncisulcus paluster TaxID=2918883 RepID=A0ABQ5KG66_9EUKA|nr:Diphthamide synthesis DPH1/DPH2 like protein [Aduncisulcus paluster]